MIDEVMSPTTLILLPAEATGHCFGMVSNHPFKPSRLMGA